VKAKRVLPIPRTRAKYPTKRRDALDLTVTETIEVVQLGGDAGGNPHERALDRTHVLDVARGGEGGHHVLPILSVLTDGFEIRGRVGKVVRTRIVVAGQRVNTCRSRYKHAFH